MALTKADISNSLSKYYGLNKREAKEMVEAYYGIIAQTLENGMDVRVSGFGNFNLRDKGERPGRNPKTGEDIPIKARRVVTFHAGQKLRAKVERYVGPEMQSYAGKSDDNS